ncbi:hypothetical protein DWG18_05950 [Lysobacter sp. TY2-98]|uniref:hypothetical protein n=1 Tax=Lysobacter sp. TY2-98 TaxID=2290922 RepID=UPI000E20320F|nr:hypothetical protein [Lysobacter sp. TY2-98]AXK71874.1 hypothetical protein DWG18_05950 [Lysobacter sp. TY2-98]
MKTLYTALLATALLASVTACQKNDPQPANGSKSASTTGVGDGLGDGVGDSVDRAMNEARVKLQNENVKLSEGGRHAEITPKGDLIIDGKTIAINEEQRRLLLEHRAHILEIAGAGMDIGKEGARMAGRAVTEAISGIFSGNTDRIHDRVEAQAQGIKKAAAALCDKLPAMYASQQRVAAAIPEFAPFAKMKSTEQDKCHADINSDDKADSESKSDADGDSDNEAATAANAAAKSN